MKKGISKQVFTYVVVLAFLAVLVVYMMGYKKYVTMATEKETANAALENSGTIASFEKNPNSPPLTALPLSSDFCVAIFSKLITDICDHIKKARTFSFLLIQTLLQQLILHL